MGSPEHDIEMMRSFIRRKRSERADHLAARLEEARRDFRRILDMVVNEFHPEGVYQWGSLLEGKHFQEISDIDIALVGITDPQAFFELCDRAEKLSRFPVHVVQMETIAPVYADEIRSGGKLVYERSV